MAIGRTILLFPYSRVAADGNCLYNAVSIFLYGDNSLNLVLRLLTTIELFTNWRHYSSIIDQMVVKHSSTFPNKLGMIQLLFHFSSTDLVLDTSQLDNVFKAEAILNSQSGTFSSLSAVMALSSVVGVQINSVYSPRNSKLFDLFTQIFQPCQTKMNTMIHLLWSTTHVGSYTNPNHFVLCMDVGSPKCMTPISDIANSIKMESSNDAKRKKTDCTGFPTTKEKAFKCFCYL